MMSKKKSYEEILKVLKKHEDAIQDKYYTGKIISGLENRIKVQEICDLFDIYDLPETSSHTYINIKDHERCVMYCKSGTTYISWPDDNRQPENEYVYKISFPTGAYIFGEFYPKDLFNRFFNELKSYEPKYTDTRNNSLYFAPENAKKIHEFYPSIFNKYKDMAGDEYRKIRAEKLKKELEDLENEK